MNTAALDIKPSETMCGMIKKKQFIIDIMGRAL